ncbi:MAG: DEAD/DEAH box helicase, partial [Patescibacteria group bacterium]
PQPMERLLAGDVGFGKTEVALRIALRIVLNNRQVVILAPTTVLADQHTEVFRKRLSTLPINIERLTRLESEKKYNEILRGLANGTVDIVIGTHRLLGKNIQLKTSGLLIVDEEQRFGVSHKEAIKERYPSIDILYLSATPIPRTLAFSLSGIRPLSQLKEAPRGRMAPLTNVLPNSSKIIKAALEHEKKRGGQAYYLANRIHSIPDIREKLDKLVPKMKKGVIHGRLAESEIVRVMRDFRNRKIDILISTTIIENGLDISSVNTLIVEDSSRLGLAQAHQLRGRIGRGDEQAFAYFMYPSRSKLTPAGEKRLDALESMSYLGAGFDIARRDFEIRGSGNILGREQSGVANKIGWNLYFEILNDVLDANKQ